jgi:hypothetical protein
MYIYRLKQYAEEKFSVTSLSSTNIQNKNTRSQSKKQNKTIHNMNPTKFGEMETGDLAHIGTEVVVNNLLLVSASPHARRLCEKLLTNDNPVDINIEVDNESVNRGAEIVNTYFFTMGIRLKFIKKPKKQRNPIRVVRKKNPLRPFTGPKNPIREFKGPKNPLRSKNMRNPLRPIIQEEPKKLRNPLRPIKEE